MAIDIYTGPLTRYHSGLWENRLQTLCRERGEAYHKISTIVQSQQKSAISSQEICEMIKIWRHDLSQAFGCFLNWNEGENLAYHTSQFSEFSDVKALSCYALNVDECCLQEIFPENLDDYEDPIVKDAEQNGLFLFFNAVEFYLPTILSGTGIFQIELLNERQVICSSTNKLLEELDGLTQKIWKVSMHYLDSLPEEEVYNDYAHRKIPLARAIFGLCKLYQNALFSQKNNFPIILDY